MIIMLVFIMLQLKVIMKLLLLDLLYQKVTEREKILLQGAEQRDK